MLYKDFILKATALILINLIGYNSSSACKYCHCQPLDSSIEYNKGIVEQKREGKKSFVKSKFKEIAPKQMAELYTEQPQALPTEPQQLVLKYIKPGEDGREPVEHPQKWPNRIHGQVKLNFPNAEGSGSGVLVGPQHFLTAAHNVYWYCDQERKKLEWVQKAIIHMALDKDSMPYGEVRGTRVYVFDDWIKKQDPSYDIALILLSRPIGEEIGWGGLQYEEEEELNKEVINVTGYPLDKGNGKQMLNMAHYFEKIKGSRGFYKIDTYKGQSGGAIWVRNMGDPYILGVHTEGDEVKEVNSGVIFTSKIFNTVLHWIEDTYSIRKISSRQISNWYKAALNGSQEALQFLEGAAERGYAEAQYDLGDILWNGKGVNKNTEKALRLFKQSADKKNVDALYRLGLIYSQEGTLKDDREARRCFHEAAKLKHIPSQADFAHMCLEGLGGEKDKKKAKKYYTKAEKQGSAQASFGLGDMYEQEGKKQNALSFYIKAAEMNYAPAQVKVGNIYEEQDKLEEKELTERESKEREREELREANRLYVDADTSKKEALEEEETLRKRKDFEERKSLIEAVKWYIRAAEQGDEQAQKTLKSLIIKISPKRYDKGKRILDFLNDAAQKNNSAVIAIFSEMLLEASVLETNNIDKDPLKAEFFYPCLEGLTLAANAGYEDAIKGIVRVIPIFCKAIVKASSVPLGVNLGFSGSGIYRAFHLQGFIIPKILEISNNENGKRIVIQELEKCISNLSSAALIGKDLGPIKGLSLLANAMNPEAIRSLCQVAKKGSQESEESQVESTIELAEIIANLSKAAQNHNEQAKQALLTLESENFLPKIKNLAQKAMSNFSELIHELSESAKAGDNESIQVLLGIALTQNIEALTELFEIKKLRQEFPSLRDFRRLRNTAFEQAKTGNREAIKVLASIVKAKKLKQEGYVSENLIALENLVEVAELGNAEAKEELLKVIEAPGEAAKTGSTRAIEGLDAIKYKVAVADKALSIAFDELCKKATERDPKAITSLAKLSTRNLDPLGAGTKLLKAIEMFSVDAKQGDEGAIEALAGAAKKWNPHATKAIQELTLIAKTGNIEAIKGLSTIVKAGNTEALQELSKLAQIGNTEAKKELLDAVDKLCEKAKKGNAKAVTSLSEAIKCGIKEVQESFSEGLRALAKKSKEGSSPTTRQMAMIVVEKEAKTGNIEALKALSEVLRNSFRGDLDKRMFSSILSKLSRQAETGDKEALNKLTAVADMDDEEALQELSILAQKGIIEAQTYLNNHTKS